MGQTRTSTRLPLWDWSKKGQVEERRSQPGSIKAGTGFLFEPEERTRDEMESIAQFPTPQRLDKRQKGASTQRHHPLSPSFYQPIIFPLHLI